MGVERRCAGRLLEHFVKRCLELCDVCLELVLKQQRKQLASSGNALVTIAQTNIQELTTRVVYCQHSLGHLPERRPPEP